MAIPAAGREARDTLAYWRKWLAHASSGSWGLYERVTAIGAPILFVCGKANWLPGRIYGLDVNDLATWFAILLFGGTLLLRLALAPYRLQQEAVAAALSDQGNKAPGRIVVSHSPQGLMNMLRGHTSMNRQRLAADYIGEWIEVSGPVADVDGSDDDWTVFVAWQVGHHAFLGFDPVWKDRLSVVRVGDTVKVLGKIEKIEENGLTLKRCELISSFPPAAQDPSLQS